MSVPTAKRRRESAVFLPLEIADSRLLSDLLSFIFDLDLRIDPVLVIRIDVDSFDLLTFFQPKLFEIGVALDPNDSQIRVGAQIEGGQVIIPAVEFFEFGKACQVKFGD